MPTSETTRVLTVEELAELCAELRGQGFKVAVQQAIWAQQILQHLENTGQSPRHPRELIAFLGPVFCCKPEEQRRFASLFDQWAEQRFPAAVEKVVNDDRSTDDEQTVRPWRIEWSKWFGPAIAGVVLIVIFWTQWENHRQRTIRGAVVTKDGTPAAAALRLGKTGFSNLADGSFTFQYRKQDLPLWLQASRAGYDTARVRLTNTSLAQIRIELQPTKQRGTIGATRSSGIDLGVVHWPNPKTDLVAGVTLTTPRKAGFMRGAVAAVPVTVLLSVALVRWIVLRRRKPVLIRRRAETPENISEVHIPGGAREFLAGFEFRTLARELRRRRLVDSAELDVPATLQATLRSGGLFAPVFGSRLEPDYLVLVDRAGFADHQARLAEEIVQTLARSDISVEQFEFDVTPEFCRRVDPRTSVAGPLVGLDELRMRFPDHRVLLFSDGGGFFDPFSGERAAWLSVFESWTDRAILTPESPHRWSRREWAIERMGFLVLPVSRQGFTLLADSFRERPTASLATNLAATRSSPEFLAQAERWLRRDPPEETVIAELSNALHRHLGANGYLWLAACAAYPEIHWGLTLRYGYNLISSRSEMESLLPRLTRLPWMRHAFMPDWVRAMLLGRLEAKDAERVRRLLLEILSQASEKVSDSVPLKIVAGEEPSLRQAAAKGLEADHVFVRFLAEEGTDPLRSEVPAPLLRLLSPSRTPVWGPWMRRSAALAVVGSLALYAFPPLLSAVTRGACRSLALSGDGETLVAGYNDGSVIFWERTPENDTYKAHVARGGHRAPVLATAFSPDGEMIVTGGEDAQIKIWSLSTQQPVGRGPGRQTASVTALAFLPGGNQFVVGTEDRTIKLYPLQSNESVEQVVGTAADAVRCLAVSGDSSFVASGGDDGVVQLWGTKGYQFAKPFPVGSPVRGLSIGPHDTTLAAGCVDGSVIVLDWRAGTRRWTAPSNHLSAVWSVAFSPDGERLASTSLDGMVLLWNASNGRPMNRYTRQKSDSVAFGWTVSFTADGKQLVLGGADGNIEVIELPMLESLPTFPTRTNAPSRINPPLNQSTPNIRRPERQGNPVGNSKS
jgi:hypothetical protein